MIPNWLRSFFSTPKWQRPIPPKPDLPPAQKSADIHVNPPTVVPGATFAGKGGRPFKVGRVSKAVPILWLGSPIPLDSTLADRIRPWFADGYVLISNEYIVSTPEFPRIFTLPWTLRVERGVLVIDVAVEDGLPILFDTASVNADTFAPIGRSL